jgi:hypothetical protein
MPNAGQLSFTDLCDSYGMNLASIPRSSERRPMRLTVKSLVRSRQIFVDLLDISEGGCKIRAKPGFAELGDRVTMKVNGINAPLGVIAWVDGGLAGVAFEGTMHPAVLDFLCENRQVAGLPKPHRLV